MLKFVQHDTGIIAILISLVLSLIYLTITFKSPLFILATLVIALIMYHILKNSSSGYRGFKAIGLMIFFILCVAAFSILIGALSLIKFFEHINVLHLLLKNNTTSINSGFILKELFEFLPVINILIVIIFYYIYKIKYAYDDI